MSEELLQPGLPARVRSLARVLTETGLLRLRVERTNETIELGRRSGARPTLTGAPVPLEAFTEITRKHDAIKADLVGIFHLSRPAPLEGEMLTGDRTLGIVEALGIRTPVPSLGPGRIVRIVTKDGAAVEYGQTLFEIDRG